MSNILREYRSFRDANALVEEYDDPQSKSGKSMFMKGIFIQGDVRNQNERIYPLREIGNAVKMINEKINRGDTIMGECDHPEELSINLDRVSHIITDMWMDGSDGYGKLKLIPTPTGEIVRTLLQSGAKLGVSSRGSGNVADDGNVSEFEIVTVDIVAQPSAPDAYPRIIYESLYNMKGGSQIFETAQGVVHGDLRAEKYLKKDIIKFISELKL